MKRKKTTARAQILEALTWGPQTIPGLLAATQRPRATIHNALFALEREGYVNRTKAFTTHGRDRVYWRPRYR